MPYISPDTPMRINRRGKDRVAPHGVECPPPYNSPEAIRRRKEAERMATLAADSTMNGERILTDADLAGLPTSSSESDDSSNIWVEQGRVVSVQAPLNDNRFGGDNDISADGRTIVVGARKYNSSAGAAYVYEYFGNWRLVATLQAATPQADDLFGSNVCISGDGNTIGVSSANEDDNGADSGAAYIFERQPDNTWTQKAKLIASDAAAGDAFGAIDISYDGTVAVVGAGGENSSQGAVYVFSTNGTTWTEDAKVTSTPRTNAAGFGGDVSISDDGLTFVAGAFNFDNGRPKEVFVFSKPASTWVQDQIFTSGHAGVISGDGTRVLTTADDLAVNVMSYTNDGGTWQSGVSLGGGHGIAISADGNTACITNGFADTFAGAAYIHKYDVDTSTWSARLADLSTRPSADDGGNASSGPAFNADGSKLVIGSTGSATTPGTAFIYSNI